MSPRPDWVNSSVPESLLLLLPGHQGLNFVGLLNCAMMREQTGKTPPEFNPQINGQTANISGLGGANYNYCGQYFFVQTAIFSTSSPPGEDAGNALWFGPSSIVHVILQRSYVA